MKKMNTMKKMYKRFLATVMAMALILSFTTVVSAAELKDNPNTNDEAVIALAEAGADEYTSSGSGIMPLATNYINYRASNMSQNAKYSDNFTLARDERLVEKFTVSGKCRIVIKLRSGVFWTTYLDETVENNQLWEISNATFKQGYKVEVEVYCLKGGSSFELQMWGE